jgi:hypothetical protein
MMFVIALSVLLVLGVWGTQVNAQVTPFTAIDVTCVNFDPGTTVVDEAGTTHIRGIVHKGVVMSDNELITGTSYLVVDIVTAANSDVNQLTVTNLIYPDAVLGSWVVPGHGQFSPAEGLLVQHNGRGTGGLSEGVIAFEVRAATVDPATLPCEPVIPPAELNGFILGGRAE